MDQFIERHSPVIVGSLSGFDRLRFRGSLLTISYVAGMASLLYRTGDLFKGFGAYGKKVTGQLREHVEQKAIAAGRPSIYLDSPKIDKDATARRIAEEDGITRGLVCVLRCKEPCMSFDIHRNAQAKRLELVARRRVCLHYYAYMIDSMFGWLYVRLQSWLPLAVHIGINGREWLARRLDTAGIGYLRRENCFVDIDDFTRAQKFSHQQLRTHWPKHLGRLVGQVFPSHEQLLGESVGDRYWTLDQSEWATDICFRSPADLAALYPSLVAHAMSTFGSRDVMRFLGRKVPAHGGVHGRYAGEIVSDLKHRPEGMCVRHRVGNNSIKMYDKQGQVLRIETTLHAPGDLKVLRPKGGDRNRLVWQPLRKGIADIHRRAELCEASNRRYLGALSEVDRQTPAGQLLAPLCKPITKDGRRMRGLRPHGEDAKLLAAVARGEFILKGFRNADIRQLLFGPDPRDPAIRRRRSSQISHRLRLLRAHGLIRKIPKTHRYLLTKRGHNIIPVIIALQNANYDKLTDAA